jgi:hypothetical protein
VNNREPGEILLKFDEKSWAVPATVIEKTG